MVYSVVNRCINISEDSNMNSYFIKITKHFRMFLLGSGSQIVCNLGETLASSEDTLGPLTFNTLFMLIAKSGNR